MTPQAIASLAVTESVIALTFDDGPVPDMTSRWLDLFRRERVSVTFFELGKNVLAEPELAKAVVDAGHEIGNHTMNHLHLPEQGRDEIWEEIADAQRAIAQVVGKAPAVFRAPYGEHDEKVWNVLHELRLPSFLSRVNCRDWEPDCTSDGILRSATEDARPGDIVLLHAWQVKTFAAMPEMIRAYRAQGLRPVTVSEMLSLRRETAVLATRKIS